MRAIAPCTSDQNLMVALCVLTLFVGMLLEMEVIELLLLLEDQQALNAKVDEAVEVRPDRHRQCQLLPGAPTSTALVSGSAVWWPG
jgi:hypothetical protein